jgi:hypothetical protein
MRLVRFIAFLAALSCTTLGYAQGGQDFSKVEIKANKVTDKFYTLDGQGGTIGVLIGPDGVFMVDTQFAPLSDKIAAAIKQLTPQPIKFVVNTHLHGDHTGGDENFGKMGATIIAREELRFRLAHPNPGANGQPGVPMAPAGLPKQTYRERLTMHMNGEEIQLIAIPRAHTDGDTMVYFPGLATRRFSRPARPASASSVRRTPTSKRRAERYFRPPGGASPLPRPPRPRPPPPPPKDGYGFGLTSSRSRNRSIEAAITSTASGALLSNA